MTGARTVAAAQTVPINGDVDANLAQHAELVRAAADLDTQILIFPELSLTGYELALAHELAFAEKDPRLAPVIALARTHRMTLVVGAPIRLGIRLHIGAFIISPDGAVDLYTKHHLGAFPATASPNGIVPVAESTVFHPGDRNPLVRVGGHIAAIAVCADVNRPAHPATAAQRGATTYLASMFVIPRDLDADTSTLHSYAVRHQMAVVFSNFGGPTGGLPSAGSSAIWSPQAELLAQLPEAGTGIVVATEKDFGWHAVTVPH